MPSIGDVLSSFADPFGPLLRERVERALPAGSTLRDLTIESSEARLSGLEIPLGSSGVRVYVAQARFQLALLSFGPKVILRHLEGELRVDGRPALGKVTFEDANRRDAWAAGTLVLTGTDLVARARIEANEGRTLLRDVRVTGTRGTALDGVLAIVGESLHATLHGRVFPADLPLDSFVDPAGFPFDLASISFDTKLAAEGSVDRPRGTLSVDLRDVPLRPHGHKRFVPHLRLTEGTLVARVTSSRRTLEGSLGLAGGGTVTVQGEDDGTKAHLRATLRTVGATAVRHLLDLAGVRAVAWEKGHVDGSVVLSREGLSAPTLDATLSSSHVDLGLRDATFPLVAPEAALRGPLDALTIAVTTTLDDGKLVFSRASADAPFVLVLDGASPRALARLSLADPSMVPLVVEGDPPREGALVLPAAWRVDLRAEPAPTSLSANVALAHDDTRIAIALSTRDGAHVASSLRGSLAPHHATTLFSFATRAKGVTVAGDPIRFDLALTGSAEAPSILGEIMTGALVLAYEGRSISLTEARARVHVAPRFVAFHDLRVAIGSGSLRGAGLAVVGKGTPTVRACFTSENIRIGRVELFPEGAPIDGRAFAHAALFHGAEGTKAEVKVRIEGPSYPFLPKATARLEKLGLPPLPVEGDRPLEAHAWVRGDRVHVRELRAGVPGLSAHGSGESSEGGKVLAANVQVTATSTWLSRSRLLRMPGAVLGSVEVPVRVRGSLSSPETESHLIGALWKSLTRGMSARRSENTRLALPPPGLAIPTSPFTEGTPEATELHALVNGTLPLAHLEEIAVRFVAEPPEP